MENKNHLQHLPDSGMYFQNRNETFRPINRVKRIIDDSGRKRRIYSAIHNDPKQSSRRFRANDRERRRMNSLNGALQALKRCVPSYHGKKRLTKLQILQFACNYINDLSEIFCTTLPSNNQYDTSSFLNPPSFDVLMTLYNEPNRNQMDSNVEHLHLMQRFDGAYHLQANELYNTGNLYSNILDYPGINTMSMQCLFSHSL